MNANGDRMFFKQCCDRIEKEYSRLGHTLGWRFLYGSKKNLNDQSEILYLGLNPGGTFDNHEHSRESCENGCAFLSETWKDGKLPGNSPLQRQVQQMFSDISDMISSEKKPSEILEESLLAQYIPFRSPNYKKLHNKKKSREFAKDLWVDIFAVINPRVVITMSDKTFEDVSFILEKESKREKVREFKSKVGWGNVTGESAVFRGQGDREYLSILRFPHLSRFRIFGRPESKVYTDDLLRRAFL